MIERLERKSGRKLELLEVYFQVLGYYVDNTVRFPPEKTNSNRINKSMTDFFDFIQDMNLLDLQQTGGKFTWK